MVQLIYVEHNGNRHEINAETSLSVMENAVKNGVPGIDADCGGACACATCHVYIDASFESKMEAASEMEMSMLDFAENREENSRLSCQIPVTDELNGMEIKLPEFQG